MKAFIVATALHSLDPGALVDQAPPARAQEARPAVDPELRELALRALLQQADTPRLISMFYAEKNADHRELILRHIAQRDDQPSRQKLLAVAKQDPDPDVQEKAIRLYAQRVDTPALVELYDTQKDTDTREIVLRQLGQRSDAAARQKLIAIAKTETDEDLQTTAVRALANRATTQELMDRGGLRGSRTTQCRSMRPPTSRCRLVSLRVSVSTMSHSRIPAHHVTCWTTYRWSCPRVR